jgi:hypothetical protein
MLSRTTALVLAVAVSGTSAVSYGQDSPAHTAELKKEMKRRTSSSEGAENLNNRLSLPIPECALRSQSEVDQAIFA